MDSLNSKYDYKSFMQYSKTAFGVNDTITLDPIQQGVFQLGQRVGFTHSDQQQAMGLYRCKGKMLSKCHLSLNHEKQISLIILYIFTSVVFVSLTGKTTRKTPTYERYVATGLLMFFNFSSWKKWPKN